MQDRRVPRGLAAPAPPQRNDFAFCDASDSDVSHSIPAAEKGHSSQPYASHLPRIVEASEFEVQAYIYQNLRANGYDVRGEVTTRQSSAILDLVVFDERTPVLIIEVKAALKLISARTRVSLAELDQEQADYYQSLGVPVQRVCGMAWAIKFCESFQLPIAPKS